MKHGHKAKEKSAKALQKPRPEKGRKEASSKGIKSTKGVKGVKGAKGGEVKAAPARKAADKRKAGGGGKAEASPSRLQLRADAENKKRAAASGPPSFGNAAVGNAFRRAVKKYSVALKRLTD